MRFESIAEVERQAGLRLPRPIFDSIRAGSEQGLTAQDNVVAFNEVGFQPRLTGGSTRHDLTTTVMGQEVSLPVMLSPTGVQALHPDGEVAVARAAAKANTAMGLSMFASKPMEEVIAANPATFTQLYWVGGRRRAEQYVERAQQAGSRGLIVTIDWFFAMRRDWGSPPIPERLTVGSACRFFPSAIRKPGWLWSYLKRMQLPDLTVPNLAPLNGPPPTFYRAMADWMDTPIPSWEDLEWLRSIWDGPFMVKGIVRPDDAKRAVQIGASALSVSTHGGNGLDGTPASIRSTGPIAAAVGEQIEVLMDSGVRRGADVIKARAFGARAVMIGRPYLWGVSAAGQKGVEEVLRIMRAGIDETLTALGHETVDDVTPDDVVVPPGFSACVGQTSKV